jgi:hypothetical protein
MTGNRFIGTVLKSIFTAQERLYAQNYLRIASGRYGA